MAVGAASARGADQLPVLGRYFPSPVASKVPEVIALFWVVKILTTAGGEATSDYLKTYGNFGAGGIEIALILVGLVWQFSTRRYQAFAYWFLAYAVATTGTGVADFIHLDLHIPYAGTTILWALILAAVFWGWQRSEGTLSIHSIVTQRREAFYWATVFATFALGTALGDLTAIEFEWGYLASAILFSVIILLPALAKWRFGLNSIAAFWMSYVVTRPLGASYADWIDKPVGATGLGVGDGPTAIAFAIAVFLLVSYLAIARPDIQPEVAVSRARAGSRWAWRPATARSRRKSTAGSPSAGGGMSLRVTVLGFSGAAPLLGACPAYVVSNGVQTVMLDCGPGAVERLERFGLLGEARRDRDLAHARRSRTRPAVARRRGHAEQARLEPAGTRRPIGGAAFLASFDAAFSDAPRERSRFDETFGVSEYEPDDQIPDRDASPRLRPDRASRSLLRCACELRRREPRVRRRRRALGGRRGARRRDGSADTEATYADDTEAAARQGHMTAVQAGELAGRARARRLLLTHLLPGADASLRELAERGFDGEVALASEGLTYELP